MNKDEILFRARYIEEGKTVKIGDQNLTLKGWAYGCIAREKNKWYIINSDGIYVEVFPETIGQYIGIPDDDGKKIFTGDIVSNSVADWEVIFNFGCFAGKRIYPESLAHTSLNAVHIAMRGIVGKKVTGNIHDESGKKIIEKINKSK